MNLIEKLGLEKCKQIVDGAPAIANFYIPGKAGYTRMGSVLLDGAISLNDLRAALADHDRTDCVTDIKNHISPTTKVIER
ncbi:hypothetical protein [Acinetobacter indicus]|uniref:hypothetical protein n=1 Tax=Acinetobacter indicus TaxID=756892 RepID=UPI0014440DA7|nr:hypothetical protein [Acinetobacter indicus]